MGKIFLRPPGLKKDKIPDLREDIERIQVESAQLARQDPRLGVRGAAVVDKDQSFPEDLAAAALHRDFFIRQVFIAHIDLQLGGDSFQLLEQERITQIEVHQLPRAGSGKKTSISPSSFRSKETGISMGCGRR
jgi:hypothetical protein